MQCLSTGGFRDLQITSQINGVHAARCPIHGEIYVSCPGPDVDDLGSATDPAPLPPPDQADDRTRERIAVTLALFIGFIAGVILALTTVAVIYRANPPGRAPTHLE